MCKQAASPFDADHNAIVNHPVSLFDMSGERSYLPDQYHLRDLVHETISESSALNRQWSSGTGAPRGGYKGEE